MQKNITKKEQKSNLFYEILNFMSWYLILLYAKYAKLYLFFKIL